MALEQSKKKKRKQHTQQTNHFIILEKQKRIFNQHIENMLNIGSYREDEKIDHFKAYN